MTEEDERPNQDTADGESSRESLREGWSGLQRREGATVMGWLYRERRLGKGFDALADGLREILDTKARTAADACDVWGAASAVMARCNKLATYLMRGADVAYAWLHLLDRYVRTWLALERLLVDGLLPMGKHGVRVLDIGTGPGPSAFATHDFYVALAAYSGSAGKARWHQPPELTCVEEVCAMNRFRGVLSETLAVKGAPTSILAMTAWLTDFKTVSPREERRDLETRLRGQYEEYYDNDRDERHDEPIYTAEEANREANAHRRYRLFTFSNFLTTLDTVKALQSNVEEVLSDARPGSVVLMIGGRGKNYPKIQKRMAQLAKAGGFRRSSSSVEVASGHARMEGRLAEEARWFYGHLKDLAGTLPPYDDVTHDLVDELEGRKPMEFSLSAVHAFRK